MIVCLCANKRSQEIIQHIEDGATLDDLKKELGVCCKCCCCLETLENMIQEHSPDKYKEAS